MVGGPVPAARVAADLHLLRGAGERRADPDMVEAAAFIGGGPIGRAVAPPRVELLVGGHELAQGVAPLPGRLDLAELLDLDGRVADDAKQRLMAPNVVLQRGYIEVADQDFTPRRVAWPRKKRRHFVEEGELMGEFVVDGGIGLVAAGRHIEIVDAKARRLAAQSHM